MYTLLSKTQRLYFPIFCFVAASVYLLQSVNYSLPESINNYLNDFLCMPIVLYCGQFSIRWLRSNPKVKLPILLIVSLTLGFAIFFEVYLPGRNIRYTSDSTDVLLYFLGAAFFYTVENNSKFILKTSSS